MVFAGVDIGSVTAKVVLVNGGKMIASEIQPSGGSYSVAFTSVLEAALRKAGLCRGDVAGAVSTGVGAGAVSIAASQTSDVSCQGIGLNRIHPSVRTIIDLGGQSTKVIKADSHGRLVDFVLSEKCAAGSGRFLQIIARILGIGIDDIGPLSLTSRRPVKFSTGCAVFAESEAVSRVAEGAAREDILAGVHHAIAAKVETMANRIKLEIDCALTGGGARDTGLARTIEETLKVPLLLPEQPQLTAALGAALLAEERYGK